MSTISLRKPATRYFSPKVTTVELPIGNMCILNWGGELESIQNNTDSVLWFIATQGSRCSDVCVHSFIVLLIIIIHLHTQSRSSDTTSSFRQQHLLKIPPGSKFLSTLGREFPANSRFIDWQRSTFFFTPRPLRAYSC